MDDLQHRILVAGGGGGGGASFCIDGRGGHGGFIGESAPSCIGEDTGIGGGGGTQESGGSGGEVEDFLSYCGSLGLGAPSNTQFGGGGGGGYYGNSNSINVLYSDSITFLTCYFRWWRRWSPWWRWR